MDLIDIIIEHHKPASRQASDVPTKMGVIFPQIDKNDNICRNLTGMKIFFTQR
jgi:hypothetical protein